MIAFHSNLLTKCQKGQKSTPPLLSRCVFGFLKIPIHPSGQENTTFTYPYGKFSYRRLPFGVCNVSTAFQRYMVSIFFNLLQDIMEVFKDEFLVYWIKYEVFLEHLKKVLERRVKVYLVLNQEKYHFIMNEGIIIGHLVYEKGIGLKRKKIQVMDKLTTLPLLEKYNVSWAISVSIACL